MSSKMLISVVLVVVAAAFVTIFYMVGDFLHWRWRRDHSEMNS